MSGTSQARNEFGSRRRLVLHMDVNNTVLVGDSLTKQFSVESVFNEYMTEAAWGTEDGQGKWTWLNDSPSSKPPSFEALQYYEYAERMFDNQERSVFKNHVRNFTEEDVGKKFRPFFDEMREKLVCHNPPPDGIVDQVLSTGQDGRKYHRVLPSFLHLVCYLLQEEREFAIIFRTFGGDGHVVLNIMDLFFKGLHPDFPKVPPSTHKCPLNMIPGNIKRSRNGISVTFPNNTVSQDPKEIYNYFSECTEMQLFTDDYTWWKLGGYTHLSGKPILVDPKDQSVQHIIFEDNFRAWCPDNSIVDVQVMKKGSFHSDDPQNYEDIFIVKSDLYQSIVNDDYFIERVQCCEENFDKAFINK